MDNLHEPCDCYNCAKPAIVIVKIERKARASGKVYEVPTPMCAKCRMDFERMRSKPNVTELMLALGYEVI